MVSWQPDTNSQYEELGGEQQIYNNSLITETHLFL